MDLHSHPGYEKVSDKTQLKANYTPGNLTDHLERYAYTGHAVTLSLGSDPPDAWVWEMRVESEERSFTGARFETVGRGLAWPGTGPVVPARNDTPYAILTPWMAEVAVRELAAHGVPFVKLWVEDRGGFRVPGAEGPFVLNDEISGAAITEAHRLGLRTMAHVKTVPELKELIRAGWTRGRTRLRTGPPTRICSRSSRSGPGSGTSRSSPRRVAEAPRSAGRARRPTGSTIRSSRR